MGLAGGAAGQGTNIVVPGKWEDVARTSALRAGRGGLLRGEGGNLQLNLAHACPKIASLTVRVDVGVLERLGRGGLLRGAHSDPDHDSDRDPDTDHDRDPDPDPDRDPDRDPDHDRDHDHDRDSDSDRDRDRYFCLKNRITSPW
jgi:hypothetical protein